MADDIRELNPSTLPEYDILCGGFPCQAFSTMGYRKGTQDPRGALLFEVLRFVDPSLSHRPAFVILENVPGLLLQEDGNVFASLIASLRDQNYDVAWTEWRADSFGTPQKRRRVILVATDRTQTNIPASCLLESHRFRRTRTLSDLVGVPVLTKSARTIRTGGRTSDPHDPKGWEWYARTDRPGEFYRLTMEDALELQGFPRGTVQRMPGPNTKRWKRIGNAIPTVFVKIIGTNLVDLITRKANPDSPSKPIPRPEACDNPSANLRL